MPPLPTPEVWAQIRYEYENTRRSIEDICLAHGISANTLRRRVKTWGWMMRQPPISDEGPETVVPTAPPLPHSPSKTGVNALLPGEVKESEPSPHIAEPTDARPTSERLQGAAARVLRAIETTSARLTARQVHLRETEMAARALLSLMRTLRELKGLLDQHGPKALVDDAPPEDMDEFRRELARRLENTIAAHEARIPAKYEAAWNEFAAEAVRS